MVYGQFPLRHPVQVAGDPCQIALQPTDSRQLVGDALRKCARRLVFDVSGNFVNLYNKNKGGSRGKHPQAQKKILGSREEKGEKNRN